MKKLLCTNFLVFFASLQLLALPAQAAGNIVIGRSLALSGALKTYGEAKRDGGDAYIKKINDAGGVGGKTIEVITLDDVYLPANIVSNLKKLAVENKPVAFLNLFGVPTVAAALPVLLELKIPAVGLTSGADAVRTPHNPYAFPVRASYADEARKLANHVKTLNISKISVVYSANPFGEALKKALEAAFKDSDLTAKAYPLDPAGTDVAKVATQAISGEPQAIFLATLSGLAVPMITEMKKASYGGTLYGFSAIDATVVTKQLGERAYGLGISQVFPIPTGARLKVVAEYVQAMKDLGRGTPSFYGLEAYIEAKVLVEGLKRAGSNPTPASLTRSLETMNDYDAGGYFVSYKPGAHAGGNFVEITVINSIGAVTR
jgi:branched-chain amino acid transport system substrate-binding protein